MKKLIAIRASESTIRLLKILTERLETTQTDVVRRALELLHTKDINKCHSR